MQKLEVEINKEILDYDVQVVSGLSLRRLIALIGAVVVSFINNITLGSVINDMFLMIIYAVAVMPFFIVGFVNYNGLPGEKAAVLFIKYMFAKKKLIRKDRNYYEEIEIKEPDKDS